MRATLVGSPTIEAFQGDWQKEWFSTRPEDWPRATNKVSHPLWKASPESRLTLEVKSSETNCLLVMVDNHAAEVELKGSGEWETVSLQPSDFKDIQEKPLPTWKGIRSLKLAAVEHLRDTACLLADQVSGGVIPWVEH